MKKAIKWIFFAIIIVIFAIDVAGFWKYKLKKSNNSTVAQVESEEQTPDKGPDNSTTNNEVEYVELSTKNFVTGERLFITDITEENRKVKCDVAFVPVGGTYTMSFEEAAQLINEIKPQVAVPIHYGSVVGTKQDAIDFIKLLNPTINGVILMK